MHVVGQHPPLVGFRFRDLHMYIYIYPLTSRASPVSLDLYQRLLMFEVKVGASDQQGL